MIPRSPSIGLWLILTTSAWAQILSPSEIDWKKVRAQQPNGLHLSLRVPKISYYQGEIIEATLTFTNTSSTPYKIWTGGRSVRLPDVAFHATDIGGNFAADPLNRYTRGIGLDGGGPGGEIQLGTWETRCPLNEWLSFPYPGVYKIFAYSVRVESLGTLGGAPVELVSDPVFITIEPLSQENDVAIVTQAASLLNGDPESAIRAAMILRYLNTPLARAALFPHLQEHHLQRNVLLALLTAPSNEPWAAKTLRAVREGLIPFDYYILQSYSELKTAALWQQKAGIVKNDELTPLEWSRVADEAQRELMDAAIFACGSQGPQYHKILLTLLNLHPGNRQAIKATLSAVQTELSPAEADQLISNEVIYDDDFLPLLRKSLSAPQYSSSALRVLSKLRPEEARPLIVEDLYRPKNHYRAEALFSLPARPLPELEPFFRGEMAKKRPGNPELLAKAMNRYGTDDLFPEITAFYNARFEQWNTATQASLLKYWMRHDVAAGVDALKRSLYSRAKTRAHADILNKTVGEEWHEEALPLVCESLEDEDPEVVFSAIWVLEKHASPEWMTASVTALERTFRTIEGNDLAAYNKACGTARLLLQSKRWPAHTDQRQHLEKLIIQKPKKSPSFPSHITL